MLRTLTELHDLSGKTLLVRIDADVDIKNGKTIDDARLASSLETISYILKHHGKIILVGHLGRPKGKVDPKFTLLPVGEWFAHALKGKVEKNDVNEFTGWKITDNVTLLENMRFFPGEETNNEDLAAKLADLADIYINESFATSHRAHASVAAVTKFLPSYAGIHFEKEVTTLTSIMKDPKRPLVVIVGGAKIETKLPIVEKMHHIADYVLVGGKIASEERVLIKVQHEKISGHKSIVIVADNSPDGLDITQKDTETFIQILETAKTIVWNGPVGMMGNKTTEENTLKIARAIADSTAYTVIGGGDSLTFLKEHNLLSKYSFVSTGRGAMLELLSGKTLPGIQALEKR